MKRLILLSTILASAFGLRAQNAEESVTLNEITVNSATVISKSDGMIIYPTEAQKTSSNNGFSILEKLALPNLRIDNISHSVSVIDNRGVAQLRINGIVVGKTEMLALDPKNIVKIDFIDNPGLRYGEGIAYVINIIVREIDNGYTVGTDLTSALTKLQGSAVVYGKRNWGKNELSLSYDMYGGRSKSRKSTQLAEYTLADGSIHTIRRNDIESLHQYLGHNARLTYNWSDSTATVFQTSFSGNFSKSPHNFVVKDITDGNRQYLATTRNSNYSSSPILDIYFFRQFTPRQSITANAVGTYISTQANSFYDEGAPYQYSVDGNTFSVLTEFIYENRLKPFTLSAGTNYSYKYIRNDYLGDAAALTSTNNSKLYAFAEIKGTLKHLRYSLGTGASYIHYTQNSHKYHFCTFRPKVDLAYNFSNSLQLRYNFYMQEHVSRIAMTSDASIRNNSMEWTVGNPHLKPSHDLHHLLQLSYNTNRLQTFLQGYFKQCLKPNMALYERTDDNKFIYTQINQKEIDLLYIMASAGYWILPEKLHISVNGGMSRCFNFGNNYTHCYTSWFYAGNITAYLGRFTLQGYIDNGSRFLEGESKGFSGAYSILKASYMWKDWQFALSWSNPLCGKYKSYENELLNCNIYKHTIGYNSDNGNMVSLNVSWRLSRGNKHKSAEKRISLQDTDNGIMK